LLWLVLSWLFSRLPYKAPKMLVLAQKQDNKLDP